MPVGSEQYLHYTQSINIRQKEETYLLTGRLSYLRPKSKDYYFI